MTSNPSYATSGCAYHLTGPQPSVARDERAVEALSRSRASPVSQLIGPAAPPLVCEEGISFMEALGWKSVAMLRRYLGKISVTRLKTYPMTLSRVFGPAA